MMSPTASTFARIASCQCWQEKAVKSSAYRRFCVSSSTGLTVLAERSAKRYNQYDQWPMS